MVNSFTLPRDGLIYAGNIFDRCRSLIDYNIWSGISKLRLDTWINNFDTSEEKYFCACILDALIYRSDQQTRSLMKQIVQRVLPDLQRQHSLPVTLKAASETLRNENLDPGIRVVPVVRASDPPTKSGLSIARLFKRHLHFSEKWIINPDGIDACIGQGIDTILFVDDFLGTGTQFGKFIRERGLKQYLGAVCAIYAPLVGHEQGCGQLEADFPDLSVAPVERLTDDHAVFSDTSGAFVDGVNSGQVAKEFYYDLLEKYGINLYGPDRRGFGHLEVAYAFEHAVPDNSIPILWWSNSASWKPLFER